jgi:hypothetical protein
MADIVVGKAIANGIDELAALRQVIAGGRLSARKVDVQSDGDTRFWGVNPEVSAVLARLKAFGHTAYEEANGRPPAASFLMVNHIDALKSPAGSGGGWHRDSLKTQYKAFVYLTDVEKETQGAFAFVPGSNGPFWRFMSIGYRLATGGSRYSDSLMSLLLGRGVQGRPVLLKAGIPFFLNTSLVHRGLPIVEGERIMASVYMFDSMPDQFFRPYV